MQITITLPVDLVNVVEGMAKEVSGKKPTKEQLETFFSQDIKAVYGDTFEGGIEDAVESYFG